MSWIPYAIMAVQAGAGYLSGKKKDKQAKRDYQDAVRAQQNDPRTLLRSALVTDLFGKHPEWEAKYPGLRTRLLNPTYGPDPKGTTSVWDHIGQGVQQAGQYYVANQKPKSSSNGLTMPDNIGDLLPTGDQCPPGQVYVAGYGCK